MGPGWVPTFLYYFVCTTLIVSFVAESGTETLQMGNPYPIGILCGLVVGSLGAYFNSHITISLPIKNRGAFLAKLNAALTEMGYQETSQLAEFTVYERSAARKIFSGKLFVHIEPKSATISGRSLRVRTLRQRLETV
jgi:hypothetical protein